jgi:hypothetical protein
MCVRACVSACIWVDKGETMCTPNESVVCVCVCVCVCLHAYELLTVPDNVGELIPECMYIKSYIQTQRERTKGTVTALLMVQENGGHTHTHKGIHTYTHTYTHTGPRAQ